MRLRLQCKGTQTILLYLCVSNLLPFLIPPSPSLFLRHTISHCHLSHSHTLSRWVTHIHAHADTLYVLKILPGYFFSVRLNLSDPQKKRSQMRLFPSDFCLAVSSSLCRTPTMSFDERMNLDRICSRPA